MLKHPSLTLSRVSNWLRDQIQPSILTEFSPVQVEFCPEPHKDRPTADKKGPWQPVEEGFEWGPAYAEAWFRVRGQVPKEWAGQEVALLAPVGGERTVWEGASPVRGIDDEHPRYRLADDAKGGEKIDLYIQAYARAPHVRVSGDMPPRKDKVERVGECKLAVVHTELQDLAYDLEFTLSLLSTIAETEPAYATILRALNDCANAYAANGKESIARCRKIIRDALGTLTGELKHTLYPLGHAHLDTAWLWPLRVTHLKMAHTATNQLYLTERYPEYVFVHSQASQYEWLEKEYPEVFARVKAAIEKGQWEPLGSMWVEADCNLTGSESLVRQFLYGRRYFKKHFGVETVDMFLPDVFGYAAALPQILNKFGIKYFLTQKISWNQFNKFPHNTFWWQGIDGTKIWTHFPPADTYCGNCTPKEIIESVRKHRDHARSDHSMYLFGFGDGGGGPTEKHLEFMRRARTSPYLPDVEKNKTARDFYRDARNKSKDLLTWSGELYLELHRGTLTSQANNKKWNRKSEFLMRDAELLACFDGGTYPQEKIEELWKLVLLNQFHDIIPGSSVNEVYRDSDKDYEKILTEGKELVQQSLVRIGEQCDTSALAEPVVVFQNSTIGSEARLAWDKSETPTSITFQGESYPVQLVEAFGERNLVFEVPESALGSVAVGDLGNQTASPRTRLKAGNRKIENNEFSVRFDSSGNITSILSMDDQPIEFIEPGMLGNLFQLFDDRPLFWEAWDVDVFSYETGVDLIKSESFEIVERGPVRVAAEVVKKFGKSTIRQRISLGPTPGIRFDTWVDWQEERKWLKVAFPLNLNTTQATYEVQFGNLQRPTHRNTSWDMGKFEVCAQKWVDMSQGDYGVALLNSSKYGHDCTDNVMRLSLLRAPNAPDPDCDRGVHQFTYALLPHYDQILHSDVVAASYALNAQPRVARIKPQSGVQGVMPKLVQVSTRHLVVEAVKKAEDSNRLVVRMYECHNTRGQAEISCARPIKRAWLVDLNEDPITELEMHDGMPLFEYKPFEIITIMLEV
ncbi:MAG: alpha-mannosidase [Armatimonadetes bacterium]|nr:alpha-mannosidase [Armatimonadota bacterium]